MEFRRNRIHPELHETTKLDIEALKHPASMEECLSEERLNAVIAWHNEMWERQEYPWDKEYPQGR